MGFPGVWKILYYILRVLHMTVNNFMAIPAYVTWYILLTPLRHFYPPLYWQIERILFKALLSFVVMWTNSGGYKIIESGDDLSSLHEKHVLLLVNHQSTADIPCVMSALLPKSLVIGQVMWLMDYIFKYTNFGWAANLHGDFFIQQGKEYRDQQLVRLREHLLNNYLSQDKRWLVLFPEGGFLYKRRERGQIFAKKNNLPILSHCTLPRLGAFSTIIDTIGNVNRNGSKECQEPKNNNTAIEWVVDMTLAYPDSEPIDMHGICIGWWEPRNMRVHYRAYPLSEVPTDLEGRAKWLYDRYEEKEKLLEHFYKHGSGLEVMDKQERDFPRVVPHEVPFDKVWFMISYAFYAVSAYIFWSNIYIPVWNLFWYLSSFIF
ncbi:acyl-CoA:lysophosphatidylglycerol acyltransferase 1-like [Ruditapes philippinarum]|uniref:acyl-CoA:lysophosphatidylglycerol acyltransferase 1-like n=1 Tax=Ruditapes philippinarum TaxID=129788 RepID=UPI00295C387D|nr:acyl-CoA:lysophosphatidylglycerol acyltransferase 1-like [Ruditapes philippinarum]